MPRTPVPAIQATITLQGMKVHRTVLLPPNAHLGDLHEAIQGTFGWWDYHLHRFIRWDGGRPYEYWDGSDPECDLTAVHDERHMTLQHAEQYLNCPSIGLDLRPQRAALFYEYDFGDRWVCQITLQAVTVPPTQLGTCIQASGVTPCEDSGGVEGYRTAKAAAARGHAATRRWFQFMRHDPKAHVDAASANAAWQRFRANDIGPDESIEVSF